MTLSTYLPQDRLRALARGESLPDRTTGAALFADISGFTALTEGLRNALGPRRGAEELTQHLEIVYTTLIAEIERHGGSVIGFAGDSMMCWFEEISDFRFQISDSSDDANSASAAAYAVACAFALQRAMQAFAQITLPDKSTTALTLKVSIATGPARRFVVGDSQVNLMDALAGATIARTALGEHLAQKGDILIDEATAKALRDSVAIQEWRTADETHDRFAVLLALTQPIETPLFPLDLGYVPAEELHPWLHRPLVERGQSGQGSFLTEFRPCLALFVRFSGIAYDSDEAGAQLDTFIRQAQAIVMRYDGALLQITIGDKGSYAFISFGVLTTHEDDARRAVKVAVELRDAAQQLGFLEPLQIGITHGILRVGAYGGQTRKTFGALGDDANLAARLMTTAAAGEILVSGHVHKAVEPYFVFEPRPPLPLKGKAEPLPVFALTGERKQRAIRLQEPAYALPMVGREPELHIIGDKLDRAWQGQAQVIGIVAEAGMGKSRLVAEAIRLAHKKGFVGYGGACQSDGVNTPYLAWRTIWSAFFDVDPAAPLRKQIRSLENEIEDYAPSRVPAMPLLNVVLDLEIPENDFTRALEPQYRKSALTALFEDCLRAAAKDEPLLIVVEDVHWIDALSHGLLEELARALADSPICFVLAYRPPQMTRLVAPRLEALPQFTRIELHELNRAEAAQAIRAKLAQLYPARSGAVPPQLVDKLVERAQGNPFFLEELLNYLRDRGIDLWGLEDPTGLVELPDSLHTLILSRIDQLSEREKTTLRVASIIGRLFPAAWLTGYYPALGELAHVRVDLDNLRALDITPLDTPEPELAYLFKHIVTHEVTYESLPFGLRAQLHEQLARYLENQIAQGTLTEASLLDTLVYHYTHSENRAKQRAYLKKAGAAAFEVSAFDAVVDYLTRLLELTPEDDPARSGLALQMAEAQYRLDDLPAARAAIQQAQAAATTSADRAAALSLLGEISNSLGDYAESRTLLAQAVPLARTGGDSIALCRTLLALGATYFGLGELDDARAVLEESLDLAHTVGDVNRELFALNRLGLVYLQVDMAIANQFFVQVHSKAVATGNRLMEMTAVGNLSIVADARGDFIAQRDSNEKALALAREIGSLHSIALYFINLAYSNIRLGELSAAREELHQGLTMALDLGIRPIVVAAVTNYAELAYAEGQIERALALFGLARRHPTWNSDNQRGMDTTLTLWGLDPAVVEAGLSNGAELDWDATIQELLKE